MAGVGRKISNLLQLVCQTHPAPRVGDFDPDQIASVFDARSWGRVVAALSVLARLKLLTPARRRRTENNNNEPNSGGSGKKKSKGATAATPVQVVQADGPDEGAMQGWVQSESRLVSSGGEWSWCCSC